MKGLTCRFEQMFVWEIWLSWHEWLKRQEYKLKVGKCGRCGEYIRRNGMQTSITNHLNNIRTAYDYLSCSESNEDEENEEPFISLFGFTNDYPHVVTLICKHANANLTCHIARCQVFSFQNANQVGFACAGLPAHHRFPSVFKQAALRRWVRETRVDNQ